MKLVTKAEEIGYGTLVKEALSDENARKEYAAFKKRPAEQFLAALHFKGLNSKVYQELKREVHNGWLVSGNETMPKSQDQTMLLCYRFHKSGGPLVKQSKNEAR